MRSPFDGAPLGRVTLAIGALPTVAYDQSRISLSPCSPAMYAWTFCTATLSRLAIR